MIQTNRAQEIPVQPQISIAHNSKVSRKDVNMIPTAENKADYSAWSCHPQARLPTEKGKNVNLIQFKCLLVGQA